MAEGDDKKLILARRARFIAAALAGVSVACGKEPQEPPQPCLSVPVYRGDADAPEPPPQPCLSPVAYDPDANAPPATDAGAPTDAGSTTTRSQQPDASAPMPCLSPPLPTNTNKPEPPPRPCLSVVKPPDKKTTQ